MNKTILILMVDVGGGHRAVADALRDALSRINTTGYRVVVEDMAFKLVIGLRDNY